MHSNEKKKIGSPLLTIRLTYCVGCSFLLTITFSHWHFVCASNIKLKLKRANRRNTHYLKKAAALQKPFMRLSGSCICHESECFGCRAHYVNVRSAQIFSFTRCSFGQWRCAYFESPNLIDVKKLTN